VVYGQPGSTLARNMPRGGATMPLDFILDDVDQLIWQADDLVVAEINRQSGSLQARLALVRVSGKVVLRSAEFLSRRIDGLER
jgi:hypothetical protein